MKNVTVSIPDDVYRDARVRAAEEGSSLSALVADHLRSLSKHEEEFVQLEAQQKRIQKQIKGFSAGDNIDREALHERAIR